VGRIVTIYQTLKDKGNPDEVINKGPFECKWNNAWLGKGYYFWEILIDSAHWWGNAHLGGNYIICKAQYNFDDAKIFDLSNGNPQHNLEFEGIINELTKKGFLKKHNTTVSRVFNFVRTHIPSFKIYEATRAYSPNAIGEKFKEFQRRINYENDKKMYLDLRPAVQICLYSKTSLNFRNYQIIYPKHYIEEGVF